MDMRIPRLKIKILLESNPLKSRIWVRRLALRPYYTVLSFDCFSVQKFDMCFQDGQVIFRMLRKITFFPWILIFVIETLNILLNERVVARLQKTREKYESMKCSQESSLSGGLFFPAGSGMLKAHSVNRCLRESQMTCCLLNGRRKLSRFVYGSNITR